MDKETKKEFSKVQAQFKKVDGQFKKIDDRFKKVDERFDKMEKDTKKEFDKVHKQFKKIDDHFEKVDTTLKEHGEAIETLQDSFELFKMEAATKTDIRELRSEMHEIKNEILSHIDGFVSHHTNQNTELVALRSGYNRHDEQIQHIAHHVGLKLN